MEALGVLAVVGLTFLAVYFLPTGIAGIRKHQRVFEIFAINLFLGWSVIGWFVAIFWALNSDTKENAQHREMMEHQYKLALDQAQRGETANDS